MYFENTSLYPCRSTHIFPIMNIKAFSWSLNVKQNCTFSKNQKQQCLELQIASCYWFFNWLTPVYKLICYTCIYLCCAWLRPDQNMHANTMRTVVNTVINNWLILFKLFLDTGLERVLYPTSLYYLYFSYSGLLCMYRYVSAWVFFLTKLISIVPNYFLVFVSRNHSLKIIM